MKSYSTQDLIDMSSSQLMQLMDELRHNCSLAGCEWAEATKAYKDIKDLLPSILAQIQACFVTQGNSLSEARMLALSHNKYMEKIKEANELEFLAKEKEVTYKSFLKSIEALAAISYVRNNELKLGGRQ